MSAATLILMRHAEAAGQRGVDTDQARPLTAQGGEDAARMGAWLAKQGLSPELVLCSPAIRAKQTLAAVNQSLKLADERIVYLDAIYAAELQNLLGLIERHGRDHNKILLIGHNPGVSELLCFLSAAQPPLSAVSKLMTPAAAAVLDYKDGVSTEAGSATPRLLMRPKQLPQST